MIRVFKRAATPWVIPVLASMTLTLLVSAIATVRVAGQKGEDETPVFSAYRGVQIGMSADETRQKLGHLKEKGDSQDFFVFSDNETAQVVYDAGHKVVAVSADFASGAANVPSAKTVLGADVEKKADGSMYKLVRYVKAGYWVSYSRTAGDSPLTTVTIQKIQ